MRIAVLEGAFATVHVSLTGGAFLTGYALMLGADDAALGILAAVPFLTQIFQLASAYVAERTGRVKPVALAGAATGRLMWVFAAVLPFLVFIPAPLKIYALILFVTISSAFLMISYNAWTVWMSELIPSRLLGRYFGVRNVVVIIVSLVVTIAGGRAMDVFKAGGSLPEGFALLFGAGVGAAAVAAVLLARQPVTRRPAPARPGFARRVWQPFADRNFRRVLSFFTAWHFSWALPLAFWNVYMLEYLRMSYFQIALFNGITSVSSAVASRLWGRIADRVGNKPVLALCASGIALLPVFWMATRPAFVHPIWFIAVWAGVTWSGFGLSTFMLPLVLSPREARNYYVAAFGIATGVTTFAASSAGGVVAQFFRATAWQVGTVTFINYHLLFAISSVGRFLSIGLLRFVEEPRDAGVPATLTLVRRGLRRRLAAATNIFADWAWPWRRHD